MAKAALTQEQWAEVRRLREELDLTTETIAARMGVHPRTIERHAASEGWLLRAPGAQKPKDTSAFAAFTVAARRKLIQRLYKAMDTKLNLMERRMKTQLANLRKAGNDLPSADHERDARAFGTIIKNIDQVKEMQADLERVAGGQPATAADAELFAEADRFRREIAERLARFIPPAR
jgi:hypothetical protein